MELYILSKQDLSILSICKLAEYQINLDEETNAKSTFTLMKTNGLKKENYMVLNGLYRQFIFVIDDVQTEKESDVVTVTALDISNVFNRKVIEKNIDTMKSKSIEEFLANTISENFVNSDDTALNVNYIEIYWHTNTQGNVATNAENGLYNFHTFLTNCRQYKNIYTDFKLENLGNPQTVEGKRISLEARNRKIVDISLHGESTQNGTPTPDNRVEIENIEGNIEFKVEGKNKLDLSKCTFLYCSVNSDNKSLTCSINNGYYAYVKTTELNNWLLQNKGKKITFSTGTPLNKTTSIVIYGTRSDGSAYQEANENGTGKCSITIADNFTAIKSIELRFNRQYTPFTDTTTVINYAMLELDSTATNYESYKSQVETFPLGEGEKLYQGSFLSDDGIHHTRKQVVFDGSDDEGWKEYTASGEYSGGLHCYFGLYNMLRDSKKALSSSMCSHFKNPGTWVIVPSVAKYGTYQDNPNTFDRYFITDIPTLSEWKNWLAEQYANGTPLILEYELAKPETVPYTAEQQEAWNKIKNLTLFEGVNHISSDANMVLKYYPLEPVGLKFVLRIDIENKQETTELIDTTLPEVADYNKIYEEDVTAKVQVYIREDGSEYNLYLKTDRTTTTNKDDPDRASGKIEVISVETADRAEEEALNVMKGNNYKHLVEFKIAKTSKLMDITQLYIGRPIRIKTEDDIYDSYISALTLSDENFVYFKSGSLRITLLDKLKASNNSVGNKLDVTGGKILGNLNILDNAYFGKNGVAFGVPYDETQAALIQFLANQYGPTGGAINLRNSDIINANCIWMQDEATAHEGINFLKEGGDNTKQDDYECLRGYRGSAYYNNIRLLTVNDLYYKPGDATYLSGFSVMGNMTSSATKIEFAIQTPMRLDNISTITITSGTLIVRGISGYVEDSYNTPIPLTGGTHDIGTYKRNANTIHINVVKTTADWLNTTNNTPLSVYLNEVNLKFS